MSKQVFTARPHLSLAEPRPNKAVIALFRTISPLYMRIVLHFRRVELISAERAVEAFRDFQEGRSRLLVAFRHPYGDEPQLMAHTIAHSIPAAARRLGKPLPKPTHAAFVHGYEVPLWMGPFVRWLLPRSGALPIHHVKLDSAGLARIRKVMKDGPYPLALAPEGQVSYTSESLPRLESGFANIAFWTAQDLAKEGRKERSLVLPVSVHYRYGKNASKLLERVLSLLERECGIPTESGRTPDERLSAAAEAIVTLAENFYAELDRTPKPAPKQTLNERWTVVIQASLRAGERALRLPDDGDVTHRFYRIRQAGWDRLFRDDLVAASGSGTTTAAASATTTHAPQKPHLFQALADRAAGEAWYAMRHMELADIGYYIDFDKKQEAATEGTAGMGRIEPFIETALNYWDICSRLRGGNISDRLAFFRKDAYLVMGEPLDAGERLEEYRADRKAAIATLTSDLAKNYQACVGEYLKLTPRPISGWPVRLPDRV